MTATSSSPPNDEQRATLPPGVVIGPDGKPCKICTAFRYWKPPKDQQQPSQRAEKTAKENASTTGGTAAIMTAFATAVAPRTAPATGTGEITTIEAPVRPPWCPPDVEELGRATWTFLHTTAAYYPEKPTPAQRANMLALLKSLPLLYPCGPCGSDFGEDIAKHPPQVNSRLSLSKWLCERHNEVNLKLGKKSFNCAKTDERWKDGPPDGSCD